MFANLKQLYCAVVCFVSTIVLMICLSIILTAFFNLFLTEYTSKADLIKYSSNENYLNSWSESHYNENQVRIYEEFRNMNSEDLGKKRELDKDNYLQSIKARAVSTIINCFSWLFVSSVFLFFHWRLY